MQRQKYHFIGKHSAVKKCRWLYESLTNSRPCYKQKFYGIKSHQCIQMTPTAFYCTQQCLFCWRAQSADLSFHWNEMKLPKWDPPEEIVQRSLDAQHSLLTGYYSNLKVDQKKLREAFSPKHVAISLTGEPTLYESLDSLLDSFHKRRFTTFLVSNGTVPSAFKKLSHEPTQLYISLCAPDERVFNAICRPLMPNTWDRLNETLSLLPSFTCPTVLRITSVKTLNMKHTEAYARLVKRAQPTYIEVKAYMHVGFSRLRLGYESMPEHSAIKGFAENLAENIGYNFIDESTESRVVLLSTLERARKIGEA